MRVLTNSTSSALWRDIIHDAETACSINLKEEIEAYLVFLMIRYTSRPEIVKQVMASEFLHYFNQPAAEREVGLQEVGDKCLIYSGLFPTLAQKRLVKISYFVKLGQSAYGAISKTNSDLYALLAKQFVSLMDIIQSLRKYKNYPDLLPLQAYDLWNQTGSQRALAILRQYSQGMPVQWTELDDLQIIK